jgi:drug/metabolite transporter (DMT)-like permease
MRSRRYDESTMSAPIGTEETGTQACTKTSFLLVHAGLWAAVIAWGGSFVAARVLLHASAPGQVALTPTVLAALRFSLAALFFVLPLARALWEHRLSSRDLLRMALLGQVTYALYFWLQYTGVQNTSASIASILVVGLIPVVTAFLAQFWGRERLSVGRFLALLLGFAGVAVIVLAAPLALTLGAGFTFGALCLVGNAVAFAVYTTLSKRWMRTIPPVVLTGGTMVSGALGLVLLSLVDAAHNPWGNVARLDAGQWIALGFLVLVCSVVAYLAYNFALAYMPAGRAAVYVYFEPVVAVALGILLLGERLDPQTLVDVLLIALSVALVSRINR